MSFIQCKNESEVETALEGSKAAFVTEDHRIYSEIQLSDDECFYTFDAETAYAILNLQLEIERMSQDFGSEMTFRSVERYARELRESFDGALAAIRFKPLERKKK